MSLPSMAGMMNVASLSYEDYVLSLNPVAYWPFNDQPGGIITDLSPSNYHGNTAYESEGGITYNGDIL